MSLFLFRLRVLISKLNDESLQSLLLSFKCSAEPASEDFLRNTAIAHEKNGISRTYLFLDRNDSGTYSVKGFFTLAIKCLAVEEHNTIPKEIFERMNVNHRIAQSYLLGQLAKADGAERGFGKDMIKRAFSIFSSGNEMFGCNVIRIDCKDKLLRYYESCGFALTGKNTDGTLNQMVAII